MLFRKYRNTSVLPDAELLRRYRDSEDAFYVGELFRRYTHLVFGVCMKYLKDEENSKDAVMQVFEKLLEDLKKHEVSNFRSWLHSVARNHCLMQLRAAPREVSLDEFHEITAAFMESEDEMHPEEKETLLRHLEECMTWLSEPQQVCIKMFYMEDRSYVEIVAATGYTQGEVKSHLQNGRRKLRNFMTGRNGSTDK
jgi:RNA polymerase sigma factor (sigma-70 family)